MNQQLQQKLILEAGIRLLEKQKTDLLRSIEHMATAKNSELAQYNSEIKEAIIRRNQIVGKVEALREELNTLTTEFLAAKEEMTQYKEQQLKEINEEIGSVKAHSAALQREASNKMDEAEGMLVRVREMEWDLKLREEALEHQTRKIVDQSAAFALRDRKDTIRHKEAEDSYIQIMAEVEDLKKSIGVLIERKNTLDNEIKLNLAVNTKMNHTLNERIAEIERREKANENLSEMLNKQASEQKEEQRIINDKRATLDRAIAEFRGKGITI